MYNDAGIEKNISKCFQLLQIIAVTQNMRC